MIGISIPEFMVAVLLMRVIAYNLEILPRPSQLSMDIAVAGAYTFMIKVKYAILLALSLIICTVPGYIKYTRSGMLQVIREDIKFIIGIGGGSPIDAAKAIGILLNNTIYNEQTLLGAPKLESLPIIAVPTTAGTGTEVTQYAILTDHKNKTKTNLC